MWPLCKHVCGPLAVFNLASVQCTRASAEFARDVDLCTHLWCNHGDCMAEGKQMRGEPERGCPPLRNGGIWGILRPVARGDWMIPPQPKMAEGPHFMP